VKAFMFHLGFIFSCGLSRKNKILTRDNVDKRKNIDSNSCLFCTERETASHFFSVC
jgi:hypothetical protein